MVASVQRGAAFPGCHAGFQPALFGQRLDYDLGGDYRRVDSVTVHPDGTVFAVVSNWEDYSGRSVYNSVVMGFDLVTGAQKFNIPISPDSHNHHPNVDYSVVGNLIIAGDGYAYLAYQERRALTGPGSSLAHPFTCEGNFAQYSPGEVTSCGLQLKLLKVGSDGSSRVIDIDERSSTYKSFLLFPPNGSDGTRWRPLISNGSDGVLVSWGFGSALDWHETGLYRLEPTMHQAAVSSAGAVTVTAAPHLPGQDGEPIVPMLQRQDGSFVGFSSIGRAFESCNCDQPPTFMTAFDAGGNVLWSVPDEEPLMALEDGSVIAKSGTVYGPNGNATGQVSSTPIVSWKGNAYRTGSVQQVVARALDVAVSFWPFQSGNPSGNNAAVQQPWFAPLKSCPGQTLVCPQEAIASALNSLKTLFRSP